VTSDPVIPPVRRAGRWLAVTAGIAVAGVVIAGCDGPSAAAPVAATPGPGADFRLPFGEVAGRVAAASTGGLQVTTRTGTTRIRLVPATRITALTRASLADVTAGACVLITRGGHSPSPSRGPGRPPVHAEAIEVLGSSCPGGASPGPTAGGGGSPGGITDGAVPQAAPTGVAGGSSSASVLRLTGTVTAVRGAAITVATSLGRISARADAATVVTRAGPATRAAIGTGRCVTASGTRPAVGTIIATQVTVTDPSNGGCPQTSS
jgi:hypothetical protein